MEVHHHSHTPDSYRERKRWTHYLFEFLMLFLAVFCGFLAEYQLEHQIEKDREKQYMESLFYDLQKDTTSLRRGYELGQSQKLWLDSLVELVNTQEIAGDNVAKLYQMNGNSGRVVNVPFETRTSSQLKNAGGMRLIRKKNVADSILNYWFGTERCELISDRLEQKSEHVSNIAVRLFHNKYYIRDDSPLAPVTGIKDGAKLITNDPTLLAEYSNRSYSKAGTLTVYLANIKRTNDNAIRVMKLISENYNVK